MPKSIGKFVKGAGGAKIYYEIADFGKKDKCLVFVHGLGGNVTAWDDERKFFYNDGLATLAIDLRGHGRSDRSDNEEFYNINNYVTDILQVLKKERFNEYVLIGHCFGGMISLALEAGHPRTVKALVLLDAGFKTPDIFKPFKNDTLIMALVKFLAEHAPNLKVSGQEDFKKFIGTGNLSIDRITSDILHVSLRSYLLACESLLGYDATTLLKKIAVPTLIIEGTKDIIIPPEVAKKMHQKITHSELDMIEGANHFLIVNNPLDVSREIERFLIKRKFL